MDKKVITAVTTEPVRENVPNHISGIYQIFCKGNSKIYIGSAVNIRKRWNHHVEDLRNKKHCNQRLQRAWDKYGASSFEFSVILRCKPEELIKLEQREIEKRDAANRKIGFNINPIAGSNLGRTFGEKARQNMSKNHPRRSTLSPEQIEELRQRMMGNQYLLGHKNSAETTEKLKLARAGKKPALGMKQSDKQKMIASIRHRGILLSEEHKAKIKAAHQGKQHTAEHIANVAKAQAKLSIEEAKMAKRLRQNGEKYKDIAVMFGVSRATIHNIVENKSLAYKGV